MNAAPATNLRRDRGAVLPLVLVFVLVLGLVLASTARYTATNLRYSVVVEERATASAAAEAAVRYGIQRIEQNSVTSCETGPVTITPTFDPGVDPILTDADEVEITCRRLDSNPATASDWAAVVTGEGITGTNCTLSAPVDCRFFVHDDGRHAAVGRIYVPSVRQNQFRINQDPVEFDGNIFYDGSSDDCASIERYDDSGPYDDDIRLTSGQLVCWPQSWQQVIDEPPVPALPTSTGPTPDPSGTDVNGCRVFEPGYYSALSLNVGGHNYFKSGIYVFDNVDINTGGSDTFILGGYPPDARFANRLITAGPCLTAQAADGAAPGPSPSGVSAHGVTWYFTGNAELTVPTHTSIEIVPKLHSHGSVDRAVGIHVIGNNSGDLITPVYLGSHNHVAVQGLIWAPYRTVDLRDFVPDIGGTGQLTSGVVAAQLYIDSTTFPSAALGPNGTQADHELLLTGTATVDGVTIEARAVVGHRPYEAPGSRVAVRSIRLTD